ncbi:hypothetical protein T05_5061 [Trichinella murrelli]|uniref:Uncharacterized protein n=1 Tax=Trichinella murrelli TaxID=144512 RepID=A0A0V0TSQ3_9BILA|nr:hypothetical protein T05_5061 [Trichinella murrelli]
MFEKTKPLIIQSGFLVRIGQQCRLVTKRQMKRNTHHLGHIIGSSRLLLLLVMVVLVRFQTTRGQVDVARSRIDRFHWWTVGFQPLLTDARVATGLVLTNHQIDIGTVAFGENLLLQSPKNAQRKLQSRNGHKSAPQHLHRPTLDKWGPDFSTGIPEEHQTGTSGNELRPGWVAKRADQFQQLTAGTVVVEPGQLGRGTLQAHRIQRHPRPTEQIAVHRTTARPVDHRQHEVVLVLLHRGGRIVLQTIPAHRRRCIQQTHVQKCIGSGTAKIAGHLVVDLTTHGDRVACSRCRLFDDELVSVVQAGKHARLPNIQATLHRLQIRTPVMFHVVAVSDTLIRVDNAERREPIAAQTWSAVLVVRAKSWKRARPSCGTFRFNNAVDIH